MMNHNQTEIFYTDMKYLTQFKKKRIKKKSTQISRSSPTAKLGGCSLKFRRIYYKDSKIILHLFLIE